MDDNELSVPNLDRLIIERDKYKDRWETLGRVSKKMIDRLEAEAKRAVVLSPTALESLDRKVARSDLNRSQYLEWILTGKDPKKKAEKSK